jgi:transcriptional regulator with XRE-family HTH domain
MSRRKGTPKIAYTIFNTFWSKKRVENGFKVEDIASYLEISVQTAGQYLTGQQMPSEDIIRKMCDLFDVDFNEGSLAFQHANKEWTSSRGKEHNVIRGPRPEKPVSKRHRNRKKPAEGLRLYPVHTEIIEEPIPEPVPEKPAVAKIEDLIAIKSDSDVICRNKILTLLYGQVDYDTFHRFTIDTLNDDLIRLIYNKVDLDIFLEVEALIKDLQITEGGVINA